MFTSSERPTALGESAPRPPRPLSRVGNTSVLTQPRESRNDGAGTRVGDRVRRAAAWPLGSRPGRFWMRVRLVSDLKPSGSNVPYYGFKSLDCSRKMFCAIKHGVESKFDGFASIFYPTKCFLNAIKI